MAAYVGGPRPDVDKIRGKLDQEARDKVMGCRTKGQGECHTATHIDGAARFRGDVLGLPSRFVPRCEVFGCDRAERLRCGRCKAIRYCCKAQQKAHWKVHKKWCGREGGAACGACGDAMGAADVRHAACCGVAWCAACADAAPELCPFCGDAAPSLDPAAIARHRLRDAESGLEVAQRRCGAWLFPLMRLGEMVASWKLQGEPSDAFAAARVGPYVEKRWDPPEALQGLAIETASWVDGFIAAPPIDLFRLIPDGAVPKLAGDGLAARSPAADAALAVKFKRSLADHLGAFIDENAAATEKAHAKERAAAIEGGRLAVMVFLDVCGAGLPESTRAAFEMNNTAVAFNSTF